MIGVREREWSKRSESVARGVRERERGERVGQEGLDRCEREWVERKSGVRERERGVRERERGG